MFFCVHITHVVILTLKRNNNKSTGWIWCKSRELAVKWIERQIRWDLWLSRASSPTTKLVRRFKPVRLGNLSSNEGETHSSSLVRLRSKPWVILEEEYCHHECCSVICVREYQVSFPTSSSNILSSIYLSPFISSSHRITLFATTCRPYSVSRIVHFPVLCYFALLLLENYLTLFGLPLLAFFSKECLPSYDSYINYTVYVHTFSMSLCLLYYTILLCRSFKPLAYLFIRWKFYSSAFFMYVTLTIIPAFSLVKVFYDLNNTHDNFLYYISKWILFFTLFYFLYYILLLHLTFYYNITSL